LLNILFCDDDPLFLDLEREKAEKVIRRDDLPVRLGASLSSAPEAVAFLERCPGRCLVFLDFDFGPGKPNGLDFSRILRRRREGVQIVYTTNHQEKAMEILRSGTEPFGFLEKGTDLSCLESGIRRYMRMALQRNGNAGEKTEEGILLRLGAGETVELPLSDILYVEAEKQISHGITYHTLNGSSLTVLGTMENEGRRLGDGFLRVHRSYLAAKNQIMALKGGYLTLSNRQEIPCSFKMRSEVRRWAAGE
jgi:two-component system response regulator AgrA